MSTLPTGIGFLPDGRLRARFKFQGKAHPPKTWPRGTSPDVAVAWRAAELSRLESLRRAFGSAPTAPAHRPSPRGASLEADAHQFFPRIANRPSSKADVSHLRAWFEVVVNGQRLGDLPRSAITTAMVDIAIAQWRAAPSKHSVRRVKVAAYARDGQQLPGHERSAPATSGQVASARTIRHRCRMLQTLYRDFDGEHAPSPTDHARVPAVPKSHPIGLAESVVENVAHKLAEDAQPRTLVKRYRTPEKRAAADARELARQQDALRTWARFWVLATTAQRPCQVMRTTPNDLNLEQGVWLVRAAKMEPAHTLKLSTEMVEAWRAFIAADAWGPFDSSTYGHRIHRAGWPQGVRPYNARHSAVQDVTNAGASLADIGGLTGHTQSATAERFYAPMTIARSQRVTSLLEGRLKGIGAPRLVKKK